MKKISLIFFCLLALVVKGQDYGGSLGVNIGNSEKGLGLRADYNYHYSRKGFVHIAAYAAFAEHEFEEFSVPYSNFSLQLGYTRNLWENFGRSLRISLLGGAALGYESINRGSNELGEEFTLMNYGKVIYGPYVGVEFDFLVGNNSSIVVSLMEYGHLNSNIGKLTPFVSVGIRHYIY